MAQIDYRSALIVGAGSGLSAALARAFAREGLAVALAARTPDDLRPLAGEIGAQAFACDASRREDVERLFADLDAGGGANVVIYNASGRTRGPFIELDAAEVERALRVSALGGFYVAQAAAKRMLPKGHGAIIFTGASASVKGYAQSAPFAMGKFALRGLAQSLARELSPAGIHVGHVVIAANAGQCRRTNRTACSIRPPSPRATCTCCGNRAAHGPGRWSYARGWRSFEHHDASACSGAPSLGLARVRRRRSGMPIYITQGRYTREAIKGMVARPEDRADAISRLLARAGGRLIGYYLTFGEYDFLTIAEAPGETQMAAALLAAASHAGVTDLRTTLALSAAEAKGAFAAASDLAPAFRSPGGT